MTASSTTRTRSPQRRTRGRLRLGWLGVGVVAAAAFAAASASGVAGGGAVPGAYASETTSQKSLTIRLWADEILTSKANDRPPTGPSKGDTVAFTTVLRNVIPQFGKPANASGVGARVGTQNAVATYTSADHADATALAHLKALVRLPGGTLRYKTRRPVRVRQRITILVVTGGTGAFAGARGTMEARYLAPHGAQHIYRLRLP